MNERAWNIVGMTLAGENTNYSERTRPTAAVSATNPILTNQECNPRLHSKMPDTKRPVLKSNLNLTQSTSFD